MKRQYFNKNVTQTSHLRKAGNNLIMLQFSNRITKKRNHIYYASTFKPTIKQQINRFIITKTENPSPSTEEPLLLKNNRRLQNE